MKRWIETLVGLLDKLVEKVAGTKTPQLRPIRISNDRPGSRHSRRSHVSHNFSQTLFNGVFVMVALVSLSACTRAGKQQSTTIGLSIPTTSSKTVNGKVVAQSVAPAGSTIQHVSININGPGMPAPQVISWDGHCDSGSSCPQFPNPLSVSVPSGPSRLIQVLVVFGDQSTGAMTFTYGDTVASLSGGSKAVAVQIGALGTSGGKTGHVAGRYIDASGTPITGKLIGTYQPPGGKPPMVITTAEIFGGWFETFVVEGVGFQYQTEDKQVVFSDLRIGPASANNPLILNGNAVQPASHFVHMSAPNYWKQQGGMGGWYMDSGQELYYGWMGDAHSAANRAVCYPASMSSSFEIDLGGGSHSGPVVINLGAQATSAIIGYRESIGGLLSGSGGLCAAGNAANVLIDHLDFNATIAGKDFYRASGINGPFLLSMSPSNNQASPVVETYDSATGAFSIQWTYLTGVFTGSNPIDGVEVWEKRSQGYIDAYGMGINDSADQNEGHFDCGIDLPKKGFSLAQTSVGSASTMYSSNYGPNEYGVFVLCPFKSGNFFGGRKHFNSIGIVSHMPYNGPSLKLRFSSNQATDMGSNYIGSESHQYVKSKFNSYYTFAPFLSYGSFGPGQAIPSSSILSAEVWDDYSSTWQVIGGPPTFGGGVCASTCPYYTGTNISTALSTNWTNATQIKLRFKVTPAFQTAQALNTDTFTTGTITMDSCSPGTIQLVSGAGAGTPASLSLGLNGQTTDYSNYYRLQYPSCTSSEVPLGMNSISMTSTPACFGFNDVRTDSTHPNEVFVDPSDSNESNCGLTGTVTVNSADPADYVTTTMTGTLNHSIAQMGTKLYLDENVTPANSMPANYNLALEFLMAGPNVPFNFKAWQINSDFKPTSRAAGGVQTPTNFNFGTSAPAQNWVSLPTGVSEVWTSSTGATPANNPTAYFHQVSNNLGTVVTNFGELVNSNTDSIVALSETPANNGSPAMLFDLGSNNYAIKWIQSSGAGGYVGRAITTVDTITAYAGTVPRLAASQNMSNNGYSYLFVTYMNASNQLVAKEYVVSGDGMTVVSSISTVTVPTPAPVTFGDMKLVQPNGNPGGLVIVAHDGANWKSYYVPVAIFNGSSWSGPFDLPASATSTIGGATIPSGNFQGLFNCGGQQLIAVGTTSAYLVSPSLMSNVGVFGTPLTGGAALGTSYSIKACATKSWNGGVPMYEFLALHNSIAANNPTIFGFNGSSASGCGGAINSYLGSVNALPPLTPTTGVYGATTFGSEFAFVYEATAPAAHKQIVQIGTSSCTAGALSGVTYTSIGGLPDAMPVLGIGGMNFPMNGPSSHMSSHLSIFGGSSLYMEAVQIQ